MSESAWNYVYERARLEALLRTALMDSEPEEGFDRYTRLAQRFLHSKVSLISLVDTDRQFFKSQAGLGHPWCEMRGTPLDHSMCVTVVETRDVLAVEDTIADPVWRNHPAVVNIGVRSYLGFPIRSSEGHVLGSFCVIDTKPRHWNDSELETMYDLSRVLESKMRLRAEITKRNEVALRLNETNLKLTEYSENVKQMMTTVAHEIRTAFSSLRGHAEIASDTADPDVLLRSVGVIRKNTDYVMNIVNDTLEFARVDAGQVRFESIVFDPARLTHEIAEAVAPCVQAKPVEMLVDISTPPPPEFVKADPTRIKQILLNLCNNAAKFTERGSVTLRLVCESVEGPDAVTQVGGACLRWDVIDTGPGLTPEQRAALFLPFGQTDASVHRRHGGSGLGLFISKKLAEGMAGSLDVQSVPGTGSTFSLRVRVEVPSPIESTEIPIVQAAPLKLPGKPRILVAEDSVDIQQVHRYLLTRAGCETVIAGDGQAAVELIRESAAVPFDMVLMDVDLPKLDGVEATRAIRSLGYAGPMIALSATVDHSTLQKMIHAGCDATLPKPMQMHEFLELAHRLLRSSTAC
jgi:signal transduction histidine kinase/CheY-like chemotaxis protein